MPHTSTLIRIVEKEGDIRTVPCDFLMLDRELQDKVVKVGPRASLRVELCQTFGGLTHHTVHIQQIRGIFSGIGFGKGGNHFIRMFSVNLCNDLPGLFPGQLCFIIGFRQERKLPEYGTDQKRDLICMFTEAAPSGLPR